MYFGQWCGSVGRVVTSAAFGPQFESSHRKKIFGIFAVNYFEKTKIKKREASNGHF